MIENVYPLSPLQEGLYFHWLADRESSSYALQMSFRLKGDFNIVAIERSYEMLVSRHAILRTFFTKDLGEVPLQVVRVNVIPAFSYQDITGEADAVAEDIREADRLKGFDLHTGSQMRLTVLRLGDNRHEFIWSYHHIIMDGWGVGILTREFFEIYHSLILGEMPQLRPAVPYSGYIEYLMRRDKEASLTYWRNYLSGYDSITRIPHSQPDKRNGYEARELQYRLEGTARQSIKQFCAEMAVTENVFFQTAWSILLGKYNNTNDVVFGSIVSGRPAEIKGIEEMIGLFINTIPVRVRYTEDTTVRELLKAVQQGYIQGVDHHYAQLADVQAGAGATRELFDHIVQFQNTPVQEIVEGNITEDGQRVMSMESFSSSGGNSYDLTYFIIPVETIVFKFKYNACVYDEAYIGRLNGHLTRLIGQMTGSPSVSIGQLEYLSADERQQLLMVFGRAEIDYPSSKTIVDLFDEQVKRTPDNIAVVCGEKTLSYRQLGQKANQLADHLRVNCRIMAGDLVGVMLDRSESIIVAIMGVLKSGGAYVVIEPEYPRARKEFIINDTGIRVMVTQTTYLFDLEYYTGDLFVIDVQLEGPEPAPEVQAPVSRPEDPAYLVYTSGSTGHPKGVIVTHRSLMDYHFGILAKTNMRSCNTFGLVSTLAADLGNTVIYVALLIGGTLQIYSSSDLMNAERMAAQDIDCIKIVPSHWMALQHGERRFVPNKCLIFGGEQLPGEVIDAVRQYNARCEVYNHYGPSETTIGKLVRRIGPGDHMVSIPLGSPFGNTAIYILDSRNRLLPIGVPGEICIGGDGLARGYLNKEQLTAERFVACPFRAGQRMYRTGDVGRWLSDGSVEFLGRKDDQVKIRGYRIEPGEIGAVLKRHPSVETALVLAKQGPGGEKELIAYIVYKYSCDHGVIRAYLKDRLPEYMLPGHYIALEKMPLTTNGKVDRKRLPEIGETAAGGGTEYVAPRNDIEEKLAIMFREILRKERIGVKDNFFALGGHSLKVVQLISRISTEFLVQISIQSIFKEATIESIAEQIGFILDQNRQKQHIDRLVQIEL